ncbi:TlpA family protein disulfide reductase [Acidisoma sp. 7E03]
MNTSSSRRPLSRRGALIAAANLAAGVAVGNLGLPSARAQSLPGLDGLETFPTGTRLPAIRFYKPDQQALTLAHYRGKGVVLNLWATWCGPCAAELPTLDALAAAVRADDIVVLPVSSDAGGAATVRAFYDRQGIDHLPVLLDPQGAIVQAWSVPGIPLTVVFDRSGQPRARLIGGADWGTEAAAAKVRALCGPGLDVKPTVTL